MATKWHILQRMAVLRNHIQARALSSSSSSPSAFSYPRLPHVIVHKDRAEAEVIVPGYSYGDLDRNGHVNLWKVSLVGELARRMAHSYPGPLKHFSSDQDFLVFMVGANYTFTPDFYNLQKQYLYNPLRYVYCTPHIGKSSYTEYEKCYVMVPEGEGEEEREEIEEIKDNRRDGLNNRRDGLNNRMDGLNNTTVNASVSDNGNDNDAVNAVADTGAFEMEGDALQSDRVIQTEDASGKRYFGRHIHTEELHIVSVDRETRKPIPLPDEMMEFLAPYYDPQRSYTPPPKIELVQRPQDTIIKPSKYIVKWSNADYYKHSNHSQYLKYAMDGLWDAGFDLSRKRPVSIQGLYRGETRPGDELFFHAWKSDTNIFHVHVEKAGNRDGQQGTLFQATLRFEDM